MTTCRLLIFDFDGTLANTIPICISSLREAVFQHTGKRYSDAEIVGQFGLSEEGILQQLAGERWEECLPNFENEYRNGHSTITLFPGIEDVLRRLKEAGVGIAIVTGKGELTAAISSEHLKLREYFDIIMTGSPQRLVKSDQIRELTSRFGHERSQVAYVGDAPADMLAAKQAGVLSVAAAWADHVDKDALRNTNSDYFLETVESLMAWIDEHCLEPDRTLTAGKKTLK